MKVIPALAALAAVGAILTVWGGAPVSAAWVGALLAVTDGLLLLVFLALDPRNRRPAFEVRDLDDDQLAALRVRLLDLDEVDFSKEGVTSC